MARTSMKTGERSTAHGLAVTVFMMVTATLVVGQLYAYLPLLHEIAAELSTTASVAALTTPAFALSQAVGLVAVGWLNQRVTGGRLFAAGMGALAVASVATAAALMLASAEAFLLGRVVQGVAAATFPPFAIMVIVEHTSARLRPTAVGLFSASLLMAAPLGQMLAAAVAGWWSVHGVLLASAVALMPIAIVLWSQRFTETTTPRDVFSVAAVVALFHWRGLGRMYAVTLILLLGLVFYYAAVQAGHTGTDLQVFRLLGAPAVLMTLVAGALLYRWSAPAVQALGFTVAACGAAVTGLQASGVGLHVGHWLLLGGVATAVPAVLSFMGEQPPEHRQRAIVFYTIVLFAGASLGAPVVDAMDVQPLSIKMGALAAVYVLATAVVASHRWWPAQLAPAGGAAGDRTGDAVVDDVA